MGCTKCDYNGLDLYVWGGKLLCWKCLSEIIRKSQMQSNQEKYDTMKKQ